MPESLVFSCAKILFLVSLFLFIAVKDRSLFFIFLIFSIYRIVQNFGGKIFWQNCDFETLVEKTLANPRLACIFII